MKLFGRRRCECRLGIRRLRGAMPRRRRWGQAVRLVERLRLYGAPGQDVPRHGKCLADVLKNDDTLAAGQICTVRPFDASKLKLVSSSHQAVPLEPLLDTESRRYLEEPELYILKDEGASGWE